MCQYLKRGFVRIFDSVLFHSVVTMFHYAFTLDTVQRPASSLLPWQNNILLALEVFSLGCFPGLILQIIIFFFDGNSFDSCGSCNLKSVTASDGLKHAPQYSSSVLWLFLPAVRLVHTVVTTTNCHYAVNPTDLSKIPLLVELSNLKTVTINSVESEKIHSAKRPTFPVLPTN